MAKKHARFARRFVVVVLLFWLLTLVLYAGSYVTLEGKKCDAKPKGSAETWVGLWVWSLMPLVIFFIVLAVRHIKYRMYDEEARAKDRRE